MNKSFTQGKITFMGGVSFLLQYSRFQSTVQPLFGPVRKHSLFSFNDCFYGRVGPEIFSPRHLGNYVSFNSLVCFFVRSSFNGNVVMCFRNWLHSPLQPLLMYYFLHAFYHFFDSRGI